MKQLVVVEFAAHAIACCYDIIVDSHEKWNWRLRSGVCIHANFAWRFAWTFWHKKTSSQPMLHVISLQEMSIVSTVVLGNDCNITSIMILYVSAVIPFIVHPIDNAIHFLLNVSLRPRMKNMVCGMGGGAMAKLSLCDEECTPEGILLQSQSTTTA